MGGALKARYQSAGEEPELWRTNTQDGRGVTDPVQHQRSTPGPLANVATVVDARVPYIYTENPLHGTT